MNQQAGAPAAGSAFSQVLDKDLNGLTSSQLALQRLKNRKIQLSQADFAKLSGAVDNRAQKGAKDS